MNKKTFFIIGGTTKAATTSLFYYFSKHPEVCPSSYKEVRYFLDSNYPVPRKIFFSNDINDYYKFFTLCKDKDILMDATPDYLYSIEAPKRIRGMLENPKVVFILRNPIERLISWYRFAKQLGEIDDITFQDFLDIQGTEKKQYLMAMEQGKYFNYIKNYIEVLGKDKVCIIFYEDLALQPLEVVQKLSIFLGIDKNYFDDYMFEKKNQTHNINNNFLHKLYIFYRQIKHKVRVYTHDKFFHKLLSYLNKKIETLYFKQNTLKKIEDKVIDSEIRKELCSYYKDDVNKLSHLLNKKIPWIDFEV